MRDPSRILITGATGHIGKACVKKMALAAEAMALNFCSNRSGAEALAREIGHPNATLIAADLSGQGGATRLVDEAAEKMGGLDLVVHCAATFERTPFDTVTEEQFDAIIAENLRPAFFLAQASARWMEKAGGSLIFLSDIAAQKPYAGYLPYCMAKAGVDALVKGLARSLAPKIRVNAVAPYVVTRPEGMSDDAWNNLLKKMPTGKPQSAKEIADLVATIAASDTMTGQVIAVDGGRLLR